MNKRGQDTSFLIYFFIALFIIGITVITYAYVVSKYKAMVTYTASDLHESLLAEQLFYSPGCFVYTDAETGRPYPGIYDWRRFSDENLAKCMKSDKIKFRLELKNFETSQQKTIQSPGWSTAKKSYVKSVLVMDGRLYRGELKVEINA